MITLNGQQTEIKTNQTLTELLLEKEFRLALIAVEYNGRILKKDEYEKTVLQNGDIIEVVAFMGGG